jgi:hypothetical protein
MEKIVSGPAASGRTGARSFYPEFLLENFHTRNRYSIERSPLNTKHTRIGKPEAGINLLPPPLLNFFAIFI